MSILDRYVLKKFLMPFFCCIMGFTAVWFIFDFSDNISTFLRGKFSLQLQYYWSQIPAVIVLSLPVSMLLAVLYSLSVLSRSNEITAMLTSGKSVAHVLLPLFVFALMLVAIGAYFNRSIVPHAEHVKRQMLHDISQGKASNGHYIVAHMFRNRHNDRLWFMRRILPKHPEWQVEDLQIIQQNAHHTIVKEWFARRASYHPIQKKWILSQVRYVELDPRGNIMKTIHSNWLVIARWSETPKRIASLIISPNYLSVPELREYLAYNRDAPSKRLAPYRTHLGYRFALPWQVMVALLLGGPLGLSHSRYNRLRTVTAALILFFFLTFLDQVFIALGKGGYVSPFVAAWVPLIGYTTIGLWLLWIRSTNRNVPILLIHFRRT